MSNLLEALNKIKVIENRQLEIIRGMKKAINEARSKMKKALELFKKPI